MCPGKMSFLTADHCRLGATCRLIKAENLQKPQMRLSNDLALHVGSCITGSWQCCVCAVVQMSHRKHSRLLSCHDNRRRSDLATFTTRLMLWEAHSSTRFKYACCNCGHMEKVIRDHDVGPNPDHVLFEWHILKTAAWHILKLVA